MGDTPEELLVQMEAPQEKLMGVVEGITTDRNMKDKEDSSPRPSLIVPLFEFPPSQLEGSVQSSWPRKIGLLILSCHGDYPSRRKENLRRKRKEGTRRYKASLQQGCALKSPCTLCTQNYLPRHLLQLEVEPHLV